VNNQFVGNRAATIATGRGFGHAKGPPGGAGLGLGGEGVSFGYFGSNEVVDFVGELVVDFVDLCVF
jgi:hypothetical protein